MQNYKIAFRLILFSFVIPVTGYSQNQKKILKPQNFSVINIFDENSMSVPFNLKDAPTIEIRNGYFNMSLISKNNFNLQFNELKISNLKDTTLMDHNYKIILIKPNNGGTYINDFTKDETKTVINCEAIKKGELFQINILGKVFDGDKWFSIDAVLTGNLPEQKFTTTRKINYHENK